MKKEVVLEFNNVSKYYGDNIVFKTSNFKVKKGEVIFLAGKSGSGKSTLLKCINKLEKINEGIIKINGNDISNIKTEELRRKVGIVFQDYNLFNNLTVLENLTIGLTKIKKYTKEKSITQALNILKKVDLIDKKDNYPDELSGGQKQRVAIARTLLMKPSIILLDEPTSALDKEMKSSVLKLIKEIVDEDMTLIIVSHEEEFFNNICDRHFEIKRHKLMEIKW